MERLQKRMLLIKQDYEKYIPTKFYVTEKDKFKDYLKEFGYPKLKDQADAIRFILDA